MSRLDRDKQVPNPAELWLEWNSEKKCFTYYDKDFETDDKKEKNRPVRKLRFLVLEEAKSVRGFSDADQCSITSNQVLDITEGILKVKTVKGDRIASGTWSEIKGNVSGAGGKFSTDVYAMLETKKGYKIVCICMFGAALGGWIEFANELRKKKKTTTQHGIIEFAGSRPEKKGSVNYEVPLFVQKEASEEEDQAALEQAGRLKEFFDAQKMTVQQIPTAEETGYRHDYEQAPPPQDAPPPIDDPDFLEDQRQRQVEREQPAPVAQPQNQEDDFLDRLEDDDLPFD